MCARDKMMNTSNMNDDILPRELLSIISVKFRILNISHCKRVDPLWP